MPHSWFRGKSTCFEISFACPWMRLLRANRILPISAVKPTFIFWRPSERQRFLFKTVAGNNKNNTFVSFIVLRHYALLFSGWYSSASSCYFRNSRSLRRIIRKLRNFSFDLALQRDDDEDDASIVTFYYNLAAGVGW